MTDSFYLAESTFDPKENVWHGKKEPFKYGPTASVGDVILQGLKRNPDAINQVCHQNGKKYTNGEIATLTIRIAQNIQKLNLKLGDVVGLCASNSDFIAPLFFGCVAAGLIVSTLDTSFNKDGIRHTFNMTKPKVMFCDGGIYQRVKEVFDEYHLTELIYTMKDHLNGVPTIDEFLKQTNMEDQFIVPHLKEGGDSIAAILCSSGTTGLPKGVTLSHSSLLNRSVLNFETKDKLLCFSTLYWLTGLYFLLYGTLAGATRIIVDRAFSPKDFYDIIERYKVNIVLTSPSHLGQCVMSSKVIPKDLSSLQIFIVTGSIVPYALIDKFKKYTPNTLYLTAYGLTEMSGIVTVGEITDSGSVGKLVQNMELKVLDDDGNIVKTGEMGELCLRQPFKWLGYYGNTSATTSIYDSEKWIHSGDIGYINDDGVIFVKDRKKDILKYNNFHFFPSEIERIINELPQVVEVCVCGIPDIVYTCLPAAAVVKIPNSQLTEQDIYDYVAEKMDDFKRLRGGIYFFDSLPKTASGKNIRLQITEICARKRNNDTKKA